MRGSYGAKIMMHTSNILSGLAAVAMGGALIFWIIQAQTVPTIFASVPSGFYSNFTSGMLATSGLALAVSGIFAKQPKQPQSSAAAFAARLAVALILLVCATAVMPLVGFIPTGAGICLTTLLLMREDRWPLVAAISICPPVVIWIGFEIILGRPLP